MKVIFDQASAASPRVSTGLAPRARSSACGGSTTSTAARTSAPARIAASRPSSLACSPASPAQVICSAWHGGGPRGSSPSREHLMSGPTRLFDRALHRRRLARAAPRYAGFLKRRAAGDIVERLEAIRREYPVAVDLGARDGAFARALAASDAAAKVRLLVETDLSPAM